MSCPEGKIPYPSPQEAWRAMRHLQRRRNRRQQFHWGKHGVYPCPQCHCYHTGHSREIVQKGVA